MKNSAKGTPKAPWRVQVHVDAVRLAPFAIHIDWLTLSMRGPVGLFDYAPGEMVPWIGGNYWVNTGKRTRTMDRLFYLEDRNGEKLMTVAAVPLSAVMNKPPDWVQVQFANRTLYDGTWLEHYDTLRSMGFRYSAVSQIDLAADALASNGGGYMDVVQRAIDGTAEYYGKAAWVPRMRYRRTVTGFVLGSRTSNKFFRCYDKTKELRTAYASHKAPYIRASWAAALGFDPAHEGHQVNRLELSVKGPEIRRHLPDEIPATPKEGDKFVKALADGGRRCDMYASMTAKAFDFRTPAERSRSAWSVVAWDYSRVAPGVTMLPRAERVLSISHNAMIITIKNAWRVAAVNARPDWMEMAKELAQTAGLKDWMRKREPDWLAELERIRTKGDTTMLEMIARMDADVEHFGPELPPEQDDTPPELF